MSPMTDGLTEVGQPVSLIDMGALRHNRIYCVFVGVGTLQLALLAAIGESQITLKGLIPVFLLVLWLGYGSRVAWASSSS
jgi:hypothetical protein